MKRVAILFCVLALLLTACTLPTAPETTQAPTTPDTAQTAAPTEPPTQASAEAPTEPPVTEPPVTEPPVTEPVESGYSAGGSPTAGGVVVFTDPSAYLPYSGPEAKYTRLRKGPLDHFEPSDDYGAVYPYAAALRFSSGEEGYSWEAGANYGLVDASGRILTDGIYTNVSALTEYDYEYDHSSYLPFWILTTVASAEVVTETYEGGSYSWIDGETLYGLISMDGSFMLPVEYRGISPLGDGFRCTRDWDGVSFEVYDGTGSLLFTGADLIKGSGYPSAMPSDGGEGLYLIELYGENRDNQYWFSDAQGQRILGPYAEACPFCDGLACVSLDGQRYGYIDVTGAWVIEPRFTDSLSFRDGTAIQCTEDESKVIIDKAGNILLTVDADRWVYRESCGFSVSGEDCGVAYYDKDGSFLFDLPYWVDSLDEDTFWETRDDDAGRIFRLNGPELEVSDVYYLKPGRTVLDGKAVEGYLGYGYTEEDHMGHPYFVPKDLSAAYRLDLHGQPTGDSDTTSYTATDQCTNETWYLVWNGSAWNAVNEAGEIRTIPLRASWLTLRGDRIMALTDRACVYTDWEGNILFSYPLDGGD